MSTASAQAVTHIVLAGGGHSHLAVLRRFGMTRPPGVRLTLVAREVDAPYSGMLPGLVAGHYTYDEAHVDLRVLAASAGARFVHDEVMRLDLSRFAVVCRHRPPIPFDLLSINVGATPDVTAAGAETAVAVKPIAGFLARWEALRDRVLGAGAPVRLAVVGGGAGGVELVLAVRHALTKGLRARGKDAAWVTCVLFSGSPAILPTHHPRARARLERALVEHGVIVHAGAVVVEVGSGFVRTADGVVHVADDVLWTTNAAAPRWCADAGLAVDARGFVQVSDGLRSVSHPRVFAAGDCAALVGRTLEKSGVYAVRQGPVLADNLMRTARGERLRRYRPQRRFLSIISTGDRAAVAARGPWCVQGAWVWRVKEAIDRRFMRRYQDIARMPTPPPILMPTPSMSPASSMPMRCGGCGAKVGASVLHRVLGRLRRDSRPDVLIGLDAADDAAVVTVPEGLVQIHTVDFFRPLVDDPYVFGQVAATHALGDVFAMGGDARTALAVVTVPHGSEREVEETLSLLMAGALEVLDREGVALIGGHTSEGAELGLGFAVNGAGRPELLLRKAGLRPGDALVLTKPIGTGALFAADMQHRAKGRWIAAATQSMLRSNRQAALCVQAHEAVACTDVTGFGLVGHLLEMAVASGVEVELHPRAVPFLPGAVEVVRAGILSTLQPENLRAAGQVAGLRPEDVARPEVALLFDPQTAGGLLAGIPGDRVDECLAALRQAGYAEASVIGSVGRIGQVPQPIRLVPGANR